MHRFLNNFINEWRSLSISDAVTLVVAVSGGADSCAMVLALADLKQKAKIGNELIAAHFDHRLRGQDSTADSEFVVELATNLGIDHVSGESPGISSKDNLEQEARKQRYGFLREVAGRYKEAKVLTAHTMNDQAETLLFHLVRGGGVDGLSAMSRRRFLDQDGQLEVVRPLLEWADRSMTEAYCRARNVDFRNDVMNEDLRFSRVRIRKRLLPELKKENPKIITGLARTAKILEQSRIITDQLIEKDADFAALLSKDEFPVSELKELNAELRTVIVRKWLEKRLGNLRRIGFSHIESVVNLGMSDKSGRIAELPGKFSVIKRDGSLLIERNKVD